VVKELGGKRGKKKVRGKRKRSVEVKKGPQSIKYRNGVEISNTDSSFSVSHSQPSHPDWACVCVDHLNEVSQNEP
jgi:hypothetical protein